MALQDSEKPQLLLVWRRSTVSHLRDISFSGNPPPLSSPPIDRLSPSPFPPSRLPSSPKTDQTLLEPLVESSTPLRIRKSLSTRLRDIVVYWGNGPQPEDPVKESSLNPLSITQDVVASLTSLLCSFLDLNRKSNSIAPKGI